ncbi:small, acid-soluble spore protein L [Heyndrickxia sporothermodurans]|uniref:Small, acid-soluble spore protein L n=1 Tax=Heyndrickxia sporothermodurans TaxID=46224 RepID=A0AB37HGQ9_9BACI|nr:small, acid-soluble spore protein L [Heyndrickxia sporothermodurans]MBL5767049.1 small, acid-soluble spore protein L [Heyndrickxia sporothermodurans]MBL5770506.1 small, acid-soluble spore protein L [Heyndrickxia sporothermodurans]MBL5774195.1 small, acid-soluble spore protein L [Heyndrickxia sporothermodurans]MBL5778071.1 small, acid-soluble spore protein L [Heyndrickxia sporothermodurans]MBL5781860.1 small, acid-soluble spore protein L [Heyndrickxia sporothermodurans]
MEVIFLAKKNNNRGKTIAPGVNPQGWGQDDVEFAQEPKSKLENAAKKLNKK